LVCEIYDSGTGIAPNQVTKLFTAIREESPPEVIQQDRTESSLINTVTGASNGVGLGLSTAKLLAEAQGGTCTI